ncbi:hypothetical protein ACVINW_007828 [Bradyrhizobium sp. USDA 4461]
MTDSKKEYLSYRWRAQVWATPGGTVCKTRNPTEQAAAGTDLETADSAALLIILAQK